MGLKNSQDRNEKSFGRRGEDFTRSANEANDGDSLPKSETLLTKFIWPGLILLCWPVHLVAFPYGVPLHVSILVAAAILLNNAGHSKSLPTTSGVIFLVSIILFNVVSVLLFFVPYMFNGINGLIDPIVDFLICATPFAEGMSKKIGFYSSIDENLASAHALLGVSVILFPAIFWLIVYVGSTFIYHSLGSSRRDLASDRNGTLLENDAESIPIGVTILFALIAIGTLVFFHYQDFSVARFFEADVYRTPVFPEDPTHSTFWAVLKTSLVYCISIHAVAFSTAFAVGSVIASNNNVQGRR